MTHHAGDFSRELIESRAEAADRTDYRATSRIIAHAVDCAMLSEHHLQRGEQRGHPSDGPLDKLVRDGIPAAPKRPASVWATGEHTTTDAAALRNAVALRMLDMNDTFIGRSIVHPSDMVPALVAVAEAYGQPWSRLLEGVSIAYDTVCGLADALHLGQAGLEGATLSPLGVVVGGSWIAGCSPDVAIAALNIAALDAAALAATRRGHATDWRSFSSPMGAVKGTVALRLAVAGVTAPAGALDGDDGFFSRCVAQEPPSNLLSAQVRGGLLFKQFPAQIFIQAPLCALAGVMQEDPMEDAIEYIRVELPDAAARIVAEPVPRPVNAEAADHNLRFCLAAMLINGGFSREILESSLSDPRVLACTRSIEIESRDDLTGDYPDRIRARMHIDVSGRRQVLEIDSHVALAEPPAHFPGQTPDDRSDWPFALEGGNGSPSKTAEMNQRGTEAESESG